MQRNFYLFKLILSIVFVIISVFYGVVLSAFRIRAFNTYALHGEIHPAIIESSKYIGFVSALICLIYLISYLLHFSKWNPIKNYFLIIFGVVSSLVMVVWSAIMFSRPNHITFDEVYIAWIAFGIWNIYFSIAMIRKHNRLKRITTNSDILDN